MPSYVIVRCPYCGRYTYTSIKTKNRLCSYCGKIFRANENQVKIVPDLRTAQVFVKELNLKTGLQRDKRNHEYNTIRNQIYSTPDKKIIKSQVKRKSVIKLLAKIAKENPITLDKFIEECEKEDIDPTGAFHILETLAEEGSVFFPEPHSIQYLEQKAEPKKAKNTKGLFSVAKQILQLFREKDCLPEEYIITKLREQDIPEEVVRNALVRLLNSGKLYQPNVKSFCIIR